MLVLTVHALLTLCLSSPAVPRISYVELLGQLALSSRRTVRVHCMDQLERLGPKAHAAAPFLIKCLSDSDLDLALQASITLSRIGERAVPPLVIASRTGNTQEKQYSLKALGLVKIRPCPDAAMRAIKAALSSDDWRVRIGAIQALEDLQDRTCLRTLMGLLATDANVKVRQAAAIAVSSYGPEAKSAIPELTTLLTTSKSYNSNAMRVPVAKALAAVGPEALRPLTEIIESTKYGSDVRNAALVGLAGMDPESGAKAIPMLLKILDASNGVAKENVIRAIACLGANSHDAKGALSSRIKAASGKELLAIAEALVAIDPTNSELLPALIRVLDGTNHLSNRSLAVSLIGRLGKNGKDAAPRLIDFLTSSEAQLRYAAALALGELGNNSSDVLAALKTLADTDTNARAQGAAQRSLEKLRLIPKK